MKNLFCYWILLLMIGGCYSCETDLMGYEGEQGVYFCVQPPWPSGSGDTTVWECYPETVVDFLMKEQTDMTIRLKVALVGDVADKDRYFKISVVDTATTAIMGTDFEFPQETYKLAANTAYTDVYIPTHLTQSLRGQIRKVMFRLEETADFKLPFDTWYPFPGQHDYLVNSQEVLISARQHTLILSGVMTEPEGWWAGLFGAFSEAKYNFLCEEFNLKMADFSKENMNSVRARAIAQRAKVILQKNPHYETDGSLMTMGIALG